MDGKNILVLSEDKELLLALSVRLMSRGYGTLCATDAGSTIQMAAEKQPDLILLDLGQPESNGFVAMEKVKQLSCVLNIPVIMVGARPFQAYKDARLMAGAKGYFRLPLDNEDLLRSIQRELGEPFFGAADEFCAHLGA